MSIEEIIAAEYSGLSAQLRKAADFVVAHPLDVATRSLRSVSKTSGVSPATFSRLSRALGFETYEALREMSRLAIGPSPESFSEKAERLVAEADTPEQPPFLDRQAAACMTNIMALPRLVDPAKLAEAVEALDGAKNVVVYGAYGSTGIIEYLSYMANFISGKWQIAGRIGGSIGTMLAQLISSDVVVILTKPPFAKQSIKIAKLAQEQGAYVVVITDTHTCPAVKYASNTFIIPTDSPQFFSSYAATLVLIETIIGMLVERAGPTAKKRIQDVEQKNRSLEDFWDIATID
ncbi:MAG: MurR/RpiR family transcriptional regulator [Hyphomicrobiales bacterium]